MSSALPWAEAYQRAGTVAGPLPLTDVPLAEAPGQVLGEPLRAGCDLPPFDTSAMDGWAVAGPGPWRLRGVRVGARFEADAVLAGTPEVAALADGEAVGVATGARLPPGATAVLRRERGRVADPPGSVPLLHGTVGGIGTDVRPRGLECRRGEPLLSAGTLVTPPVVGLAAAAGHDTLPVVRRPRVDVLVLGDELLDAGLPRDGRIRDALGPMLPGWLTSLGAGVEGVRHVRDTIAALRTAIGGSRADVLVTTGGTAAGPVDHVHTVLAVVGARTVVDGVAVRPGHPMLLAVLDDGRPLVGLPGNPLAAVSGLLTLLVPLLRALAARPPAPALTATLTTAVTGHPTDTRLVPVRGGEPLHHVGPAMLRGLAAADGMAVVPPGGAPAGTRVGRLALPW